MEHLNRIELQGYLWSVYVKDFGNTRCANLCVLTQCHYTSQDGSPVIEDTWHYVTAWESENVKDLDRLTVGVNVHIVGRFRVRKRTRATGESVTTHDIIASKFEVIER